MIKTEEIIKTKELREYQKVIVDDIVSSKKDILICLPTGGGKTVIASAIMQQLPGTKIFIVPRLELISQAKNEFGEVDVLWANKTSLEGRDIIIASKDSLRTQYESILEKENITLIFDEAHIGIKQTKNLVELIPHTRVLGLTATPERMDGYALLKGTDEIHKYGVFDELYQKETVPSLIKKGYLAPLKYYARPIEGITKIRPDTKAGEELSERQIRKIFDENHVWGDLVECYETYGKGKPAIGFTTTVALADTVTELFCRAGYKFRTIHGNMPVKERQQLIDDLKSRKIDGLVNAALLTYGFDCPEASYAFSCRHIKSRPLWFQMIGRILRPCAGKKDAIFIDHGDSISEFSEPDCALPIMDELIQWRADGENKLQKEARKKKQKKAQEIMKEIQTIDPLPVGMVEVTMEESTQDRLLRIVKKLKSENKCLKQLISTERSENKKKAEKISSLQQRNIALEKAVVQKPKSEKIIDSEKTFEFIKRNYWQRRRRFSEMYANPEACHRAVILSFKDDENKLDFLYDMDTFKRGMDYWKDHYTSDWKPSASFSRNTGTRRKSR